MSINLVKGAKVDLTKGNPNLNGLMIGLGWDVNNSGRSMDLDAGALLIDEEGYINGSGSVVCFRDLKSSDGSVQHMGDNLTGAGDGDDEQIFVNLDKVSPNIKRIMFVVNIFSAQRKGQDFSQVDNAFIRVVDDSTGAELLRYDLGKNFAGYTSLLVAEIYRHNGEWKFNALGQGGNLIYSELPGKRM